MVEKKKTVQKKIQDEQNAFQGFMRTDLTMFDYLLTAWRLLEKLTCQILSYVATTVEARSNGNLVVVVAFGVGSCLTDYECAALQNGKWCVCVCALLHSANAHASAGPGRTSHAKDTRIASYDLMATAPTGPRPASMPRAATDRLVAQWRWGPPAELRECDALIFVKVLICSISAWRRSLSRSRPVSPQVTVAIKQAVGHRFTFLHFDCLSYEKTRTRFDTIPECDGQTDGRIWHNNIARCMHAR